VPPNDTARPADAAPGNGSGTPRGGRPRVIVVMPAYNAAATLERTVGDLPPGAVDEVVLVDDCSRDGTVAEARRLGLTVVPHERNTGYGGNQKTCYREALARGADVIVMVHPDYQYDPRLVPFFVGYVTSGVCDVMLGSRVRTRKETIESGMPWWKYVANRFLTTVENVALGQNLGDFHSGFRVYSRRVLETIPWEENDDGFVFDSEFLAQAAWFGFRIGDAPVPCRYFDEASSIRLGASVVYGTKTLGVLVKFWLQRLGIARYRIFRAREAGSPSPAAA